MLFAPAQINPSAKDGSRVSQKRTLYASKTSACRLGAKLLSLVPKSLIFYEATNTQIEATSTQLAKRAETRGKGIYICPVGRLFADRWTPTPACPSLKTSPQPFEQTITEMEIEMRICTSYCTRRPLYPCARVQVRTYGWVGGRVQV